MWKGYDIIIVERAVRGVGRWEGGGGSRSGRGGVQIVCVCVCARVLHADCVLTHSPTQ